MPTTFNNYNFSPAIYTVAENGNISAEVGVATLTIIPNSGYTVTAADFSLDPGFSNQYVSTVTFAQSGVNVICSIVFLPGASMPSNNVTIPLCIIGEAELALKTVQGTYTSTISPNITPVSQSNIVYSNSGTLGQNELLFTKTYTAASGHYLTNPSLSVTNGIISNYNIVETPTYNSSGDLTSIQFSVYYTYPEINASGDTISIVVGSKALFVPVQEITSWNLLTTNINPGGELRNITLFGGAGATFTIAVSNGTTSYNLATNQTIDASGLFTIPITFPSSSTNVVYTITLSGDIASPFTQPNPIVLNQYALTPTITIAASSNNNISGFVNAQATGNSFEQPSNLYITSTSTLAVSPNTSSIVYNGSIENSNFKFTQTVGTNTTVNGTVTNSSTLVVDDATGVLAGDKFNLTTGSNLAPFEYSITNVSGNNLTVSPNITASNDTSLFIYRNKGNIIDDVTAIATQVNNYTISMDVSARVANFGDADVTFTLDLDEIIDVTSASQVFGPFGLGLSSVDGATACCSVVSQIRYLNSNSLTTATEMYTDSNGSTLAPAGFYSFDGNYRYWNGTIFTSALISACPSCFTTLTLCYSSTSAANLCCNNSNTVTVYVALGQTFENNTGMYSNQSLTTAAADVFYSSNTCNTQTP